MVVQRFHTALVACSNQAAGTKFLLTSFNGRTLGCGPGDAVFDSPSQDQSSFPMGVKLKRTSAGLQNRKLQVRGLPPLPVLGSVSVEILSATKNAAIKVRKVAIHTIAAPLVEPARGCRRGVRMSAATSDGGTFETYRLHRAMSEFEGIAENISSQ